MNLFQNIQEFLLHLAFPHVCEGCGSDLADVKHALCLRCFSTLPHTDFQLYPSNPVEKIFWGRLPLSFATSQYYYSKASMMQQLLHQIKYRGNRDLGFYLGGLMGDA